MKRAFVLAAVASLAAIVVLAIGSLGVAGGAKTELKADTMIGYPEAPAVSTAANGSFEATIDDEAEEIAYTLSYSGLEDVVRQAHIHFAQRGVSGGISAWLCETTLNPRPVGTPDVPDCPQSGTVTGTLTPDHVIGPAGQGIAATEFDELVAALRAGRAYANVHTTKFPGGEIRGQINDDNQRDD